MAVLENIDIIFLIDNCICVNYIENTDKSVLHYSDDNSFARNLHNFFINILFKSFLLHNVILPSLEVTDSDIILVLLEIILFILNELSIFPICMSTTLWDRACFRFHFETESR